MKNILIIGVGGTGSNAVDMLYHKIAEIRKKVKDDNTGKVISVVFDTDDAGVESIRDATAIPMTDPSGLGAVCDRLGEEHLREWFPYDVENIRSQELTRGAGQWRKKSYLAFMNLMNNSQKRSMFHQALESLRSDYGGAQYEIYTVASIAGGTGSGSFIPITLYAKRYIREHLGVGNIQTTAMLACPDIYADSQTPDNRTKIFANAYAILRELNAMSQVVNGANDPAKRESGTPPIHLRIGNDNNPYVGLLFDADNPEYWRPEAAPFERVFMLDKIPGLSSITAHDAVLANSLYSIVCTQVGPTVDSEISNHAILLTQNDGHNAIYAGIGTSEMSYPVEAILNYVAHRKTEDDSEGEWMLLHNATEEKIAEEAAAAAEARRIYMLKDGEYAKKWLTAAAAEERTPTSAIPELLRRGTTYVVQDGDKVEERAIFADYWEKLTAEIQSRIPSIEKMQDEILSVTLSQGYGFLASKATKDAEKQKVASVCSECYDSLDKYYHNCVDTIRDNTTNLYNAILPLAKDKEPTANPALSFVTNVLMKDGKYIHPVAAMKQLCTFKTALKELLSEENITEWKDITTGELKYHLSSSLLGVTDETAGKTAAESKKSAYIKLGANRFSTLHGEGTRKAYLDESTDTKIDSEAIINDAKEILESLRNRAAKQLRNRVLLVVSKNIDLLIDKYRTFFSRFGEERDTLKEATQTARNAQAGVNGAVIYLFSSPEDKDAAYENFKKNGGAMKAEDILAADDIAGGGVFSVAYEMALAEALDSEDAPKTKGISDIFDAMVKANKDQLRKSDYFTAMASKSVFDVIADHDKENPVSAERKMLSMAFELAKPALQPDNYKEGPKPSEITVFLIATEAVRYLKKNSSKFGLSVPSAGSEGKQLLSIAQEFIHHLSAPDARVAIVNDIPASSLLVTREVVDVQPTHLRKVDECSPNPIYFNEYKKAIEKMESTKTDMWNPHLSYNLHRRGYMPYINLAKEKESDVKLMKALLYAIMTAKISYRAPLRQERGFRYSLNGVDTLITDRFGGAINERNLSGLITWLRPQDALIEKWYQSFENDMRDQLEDLRPVYSSGDIPRAEADITKAPYIVMMRDNLFKNIIDQAGMGAEHNATSRLSLSLFEFYNKIKCSEESGFDCDDAEKILEVGYDTFRRFCNKCVSEQNDPSNYMTVYEWQLDKFMIALCKDADIQKESDPLFQATRLIAMVNEAGYFKSIDRIIGKEITYRNYVLSDAARTASASVAKELEEAKKKAAEASEAPVADTPADKPADDGEGTAE